jgi:hypothetical protein
VRMLLKSRWDAACRSSVQPPLHNPVEDTARALAAAAGTITHASCMCLNRLVWW